jgi:hypothetical protein
MLKYIGLTVAVELSLLLEAITQQVLGHNK